jgi:uncharacterized membrane protein YqjE
MSMLNVALALFASGAMMGSILPHNSPTLRTHERCAADCWLLLIAADCCWWLLLTAAHRCSYLIVAHH